MTFVYVTIFIITMIACVISYNKHEGLGGVIINKSIGIYLITQSEKGDCRGAIVYAHSAEEARCIAPTCDGFTEDVHSDWASSPRNVKAKYIGKTYVEYAWLAFPKGVIIVDYVSH